MYKIECNEGPLRLVRSPEQVSQIHSNVMHGQVLAPVISQKTLFNITTVCEIHSRSSSWNITFL